MQRLLLVLVFAVACSSDVRVTRVSQEDWYSSARRNVLSSDDVSDVTRNMLRRRSLDRHYRQNPEAAIRQLMEELQETRQRELAVAIAELAYLQTKRVNAFDPIAVGTTIRYSYAYLFDSKLEPARGDFDAQFRWACDLYNAAVADKIRNTTKEDVRNDQLGSLQWYGGSSPLTINSNDLLWELKNFEIVRVTRDYRVAKLPSPDVRRGFGVPVTLRSSWNRRAALRGDAPRNQRYLPPFLTVALTVVVRFADGVSVLDAEQGGCVAELLDATEVASLTIEGETVPLEFDFTTPLAATLTGLEQSLGLAAFRKGSDYERKGGLYMFRPHRPGRIPVLFVHGLASDPYTWLALYNDLMANETIRRRCEFVFWFYPTGQPILRSAAQLRDALLEARALVDPERDDASNDWAVVCGHSMGGILTRSLVTDSGDAIWNAVFDQPIDELDLTEGERDLLQRTFFFEAAPGVRRVIFYASPHRGSPQADTLLGKLSSSLATIPDRLASDSARLARKTNSKIPLVGRTSIAGLRPENPVLIASMTCPISDRVTYHSIIGDENTAGATNGTDGFVPYWSSHLDGAESELVVRSGHSVQQTPRAARETRRILLKHIAAFDAAQAAAKDR